MKLAWHLVFYRGIDLPVDPLLELPGKIISHDALHTRGLDLPVDLPPGQPNLNTVCISCFASQRSFLQKTNMPQVQDQSNRYITVLDMLSFWLTWVKNRNKS